MSIIVEAGDGHAWRSLCVLAEADLALSYAHQLKSAVEALIGIPAELQHLFLGRKKITDTLSLAGQGLQPGAVVRLQIPLLAGDPGSIKVTGLDPNVTEADLSTAFDDYGDVKSVKLIHSKDPNKPNPHCFINFATLQDAQRAIDGMQGRVIGQQRIHCTLQQQQSQGPSSSSVVYHPVKVGNLSDRVTESMLRQAFGKAGTILNIELKPGDPPYAFVNYQNEADVWRAVNQFHRQMVCGVKVNVIEKPQRTVSKAGPTSPVRSASASTQVYPESEKDAQSTFSFSSVDVGHLVVAFHMDQVSRIAHTHSVSVKVDAPKVPAVAPQSATLHISGKLASVKQCIVDLEKWQSTRHADKSSCKVTGLAATALPECQMDIDALANQHEVLCDLNDPVDQLAMAVECARISPAPHAVPGQASSAMVWEWMDDDGWKPYDLQTCQGITQFQAQRTSCRVQLQGASYIIDPINMSQTNETSGHRRKIRCTDPSIGACAGPNSSYKWQYLLDDGHFADFLPSDSSKVENAYRSGQISLDLSVGQWTYTIYVMQCIQKNTVTGAQRQIRRVPDHRTSTSTVAASDAGMSRSFKFSPCLTEEISVSASTLVTNSSAYLMAPTAASSNFLSRLRHCLEQAVVEAKKIDVPPGFNTDIQDELKALAQSQLVGIEYQIEGASRQFVVTGSKKRVLEAANQVQGLVSVSLKTAQDRFPKEWKSQCEDLELVPVGRSSQEFADIEERIRETLPDALIGGLHRIQNKFLWRKFVQNQQEIREVNGTPPKVMHLFHGTRQTAPEKVYRNQEGFDMRFSADGLWGRANYFAVNAAYSHHFSHQPVAHREDRQMLLAVVTIGESIELAEDRRHARPPIRIQAGSQVHGDILYDTINGITHGHRVFMTYNNRQAYPRYLITYTSP